MGIVQKSAWSETIDFSDLLGIDRRKINGALRSIGNDTQNQLIGHPRGTYGPGCQPPTNEAFKAMVQTADFGPFRATGIRPAVAAVMAIMEDIKVEKPDIYPRLGSAGMLCCRLVRGSTSMISNHSWGTAIDLTIDGQLDQYGGGGVQRGLLAIAPIFQRHRFYWGAAFRKEDSMHFEASEQLVRDWAEKGLLGAAGQARAGQMTVGSRGPEVQALQQALNRELGVGIDEDGLFGPLTRAAVVTYQTRIGMKQTGNVGPSLLKKLGLS